VFRYMIFALFVGINLFGWSLLGLRGDKNLSSMGLGSDDVLWAYQDGSWKSNKNYSDIEQLVKIKGGEGFWSKNDINISQPSIKTGHIWSIGWNMVSPVYNDWNMSKKFDNNESIKYAWRYDQNSWKLYSKKANNYGRERFSSLSIGQGAWIYYMPPTDLYFGSTGIYCDGGSCGTLKTSDNNFLFKIKTDSFASDMKVGFDLYRYSNKTHYKFALGPFKLQQSSTYLAPSSIPVCVSKQGVGGSCNKIDSTKKFAYYQNGFLVIDSQKIASLFGKSIPSSKEKFHLKLYISGFSVNGFAKADDFGTMGVEGFGTAWVTIKNDKAVQFDIVEN